MKNEENIGSRIEELRKDNHWSQKDLAEKISVARSQISRIESGDTKNVGNDILISLAKLFHVSTDYLLGITNISAPKNYDISVLGLSEKAVRRLASGMIDTDIINLLLEHKNFPYLCSLIRSYYDNSLAEGILSRNQIIDLATEPLMKLIKTDPAHCAEARSDLRFLNSQKLGINEADTEKIKSIFMGILRDVKKEINDGVIPSTAATDAIVAIQSALPEKPQQKLTVNDISKAVADYAGSIIPMDEETTELIQKLMEKLAEQCSN